MGSYSKIVKKAKKTDNGFLPESWRVFIARRVLDACAALLFLCGTFLLFSLASYTPDDPSFNTASGDRAVQNWMGSPGAHISDLLLQTLGVGGVAYAIIFCVLGLRVWRRHEISPLWFRFPAIIVAGILTSLAFSMIPSGHFLPHPYLGGSGGTLMLERISMLVPDALAGTSPRTAAATICSILAAVFFCMACAVRFYEVAFALGKAWDFLLYACSCISAMILSAYDWVRHYGDPDYEMPHRMPVLRKSRAPYLEATDVAYEDDTDDEEETKGSGGRLPQISAPARHPIDVSGTVKAKVQNHKKTVKQQSLALHDPEEWEFPPVDLLQEVPDAEAEDKPDKEALRKNALLLQNVLADFNVEGEIVSIHPGPVVTLYELEPSPGTKTSRVIGLADDIARSMSAISVRCSVVPGRNVIGIELPNKRRQTVYMREMLESDDVVKSKAILPLILGKDIGGVPVVADLAKMPHLLIAGTTGSGKSVAVNTMILSLLYNLPPEKCRFIMIDPKMLELSVYDDIPHLLAPVVTEPGKAVISLKWAVQEMEDRYRAMSKLGVRNIEGYNQRLAEARKKGETLMRKVQTGFDADTGKPVFEEQPMDTTELPYIVVIVDEFADLMLVAGKDVESAIQRLAQMARAAGIHLIMATQRPSVDVITGVIKANFPTRISFAVTSKIDSRTILGEGGAEQLLGMGDMLYMASGGRIRRVHGPFVADDEVESVVGFLKAQAEPSYIDDITEGGSLGSSEIMGALFGGGDGEGVDELYDQAVALVARERKASTSFVQRYLQIGYNRAARIIEEMERQGVISSANHVGKRDVLVGDYSDA